MSGEEMLHVICVRRDGTTAASVYLRPRTCLWNAASLLSTLARGTIVHVILEEIGARFEWRAVATGRPPAWLVDEQRV